MREAIAKWLAPELARKAEMHDWLVSEISYEARWLGEFRFVSRTLDRLLSIKADHFRPLGNPARGKEESEISRYRDVLRREAVALP